MFFTLIIELKHCINFDIIDKNIGTSILFLTYIYFNIFLIINETKQFSAVKNLRYLIEFLFIFKLLNIKQCTKLVFCSKFLQRLKITNIISII